jgi:hypothetical protein
MTWNERKSEMSDKKEKTTEERLSDTEEKLGKLSEAVEKVRKNSVGIIKDLNIVHTDMQAAIAIFKKD